MTTPEKPLIWTKENIEKAINSTGKPFEVEAAKACAGLGWEPFLGTYYYDSIRDSVREIDVVAEKRKNWKAGRFDCECIVRALISCRGFPQDHRPVAYYVSPGATPKVIAPRLPCNVFRIPNDWQEKAWEMLPSGVFHSAQRITSLDVLKENPNKEEKKDLPLKSVGDGAMEENKGSIFSALDSAFKAAIYWRKREADYAARESDTAHYLRVVPPWRAIVHVPVLALTKDWFGISLDGGKARLDGEILQGHVTVLYPSKGSDGSLEPITCLVCSRTSLIQTIQILGQLHGNIVEKIQKTAGGDS